MSVFDYMKELTLFDNYENKVIKMLIDELNLYQHYDFKFLNEINLNNVEFFWYKDSNDQVLGGYHFLSYDYTNKKYAIYINKIFQYNSNENNTSAFYQKMNNIILVFPILLHQLCHYWQAKKYPYLYFILQLPIIRDYTIQKQAYRISDYLYSNNWIQFLGIKDLIKLKQKYNFQECYYDEIQKKLK